MKVGTDSLYSIISVRVTQCQFPQPNAYFAHLSTHWGRVTHICVTRLTTIGSVNGLSPGRRQAIIWTNAGILLIVPLGSLMKFYSKFRNLYSRKPNWKCSLENGDHFISAPMFYRNPTNPKGSFYILKTLNTLRPRQNGRHFADDIFKCIFLNENARISIKISLKFVPKARINNIPALVQIMAWRRPGDKPLSEPMMVILLTHICVTRPQWVKRLFFLANKPRCSAISVSREVHRKK